MNILRKMFVATDLTTGFVFVLFLCLCSVDTTSTNPYAPWVPLVAVTVCGLILWKRRIYA